MVEIERQYGSLLRAAIALGKQRKAEGRGPSRLTSLEGGMGTLPAALAAALGERLRLGAAVTGLQRTESGWRVSTRDGAVDAEHVVVALPADESAALLRQIDAPAADAFGAIAVAGVVAVALGYARVDVPHKLDGFGFLVPRREHVRLLGSIWMTSTFPKGALAPPDHVLLRCLLGGAHDPAALDLSDEELIAEARAGLRAAIGVTAEPCFSHVARWRRGIAQYEVGHAGRVALIEARCQALGIFPTGAALRGVGVNDVVREATALAERMHAR
jgi:oxygen-dependent protoporphyrinogen oxidase